MSYAPAVEPRRRPAVVSSAVALLYLVVALIIAQAVLNMYQLSVLGGALDEAFRQVASSDELRALKGGINFVGVVMVIFGLVLAGGFLTLALLTGKGKNAARIVTWVFAGIGIVCCGFGALGNALSPTSSFNYTGNGELERLGIDEAELERRMEESLPSWVTAASTAIVLVILLALILVVILLSLPDANSYFAKPSYGWAPGYYGAQPPYPGGPAYPGQQFPGQQFPGQAPPPYPGQPPYPGHQPYGAPQQSYGGYEPYGGQQAYPADMPPAPRSPAPPSSEPPSSEPPSPGPSSSGSSPSDSPSSDPPASSGSS